MADTDSTGSKALIAVLLAVGAVGCASDGDVSRGGGALIGGLPDVGRDALDQERRDAVVLVRAGADDSATDCFGTLVSPRVILTAWHCVGERYRSRPLLGFGQTFPLTPEQNVRGVECHVYPGARTDGVTPTCFNFPYRALPPPGGTGYTTAFREPFDLAIVVLEERVDAANRAAGPRARPMRVAFEDPGADPSSWIGLEVREIGQDGRTERLMLASRVTGLSHGESRLLFAPSGQGGDSGGAWIWEPPGQLPQIISVFNLNPRLAAPEVRDWLRPIIEPATAAQGYVGSVYVGPTDVPSVENPDRAEDPAGYAAVDPDGDGLVGAHDNCPGLRNIAQRDANLDGIGDACDADSDGVLDVDDNCAEDANPGQEDCDEDGVGDACALDEDFDGVPDACDDCASVYNLEQGLDCNADAVAELNRRLVDIGVDPLPELGDACDPIPCGDTRVREDSRDVPGAVRFTMDEVLVDGRGDLPFAFPVGSARGRTEFRFCQCRIGFFEDISIPPDGVFDRFVQTDVVEDGIRGRELCQEPQNGGCLINDLAQIHDPTDTLPPFEFPRWHWTTHQGLDGEPDGMPVCPEPPASQPPFCVSRDRVALAPRYPSRYRPYRDGDGFVPDRSNRWLWREADVPRWVDQGFGDPLRDTVGSGPGLRGALSGVLWTHTPGVTDPGSADYPFFETPLLREQASHYWSGRALAPFEVPRPAPCFVPLIPFLGGGLSCPFCPSSFPGPAIGFPAIGRCRPDLRFPGLFVGNARIDPSPALELPGLDLFAGDPGPWLAAAETGAWLPTDGLRYVKVTSGSVVERTILEVGGVFAEPGGCVPGQCDPIPIDFARAAVNAPGDVPEARIDHGETLSARRGGLWIVGGNASSDGRLLDEVWAYDLTSEEWCLLAPGARPQLGRVHATTYSAAQNILWVLDEVEVPRPRHARHGWPYGPRRRLHVKMRLIRLDPAIGSGEVVAEWSRGPRRLANQEFALAADGAGTLYVVGWRGGGRRGGGAHHVVLRLRPGLVDGVELLGWSAGHGRVLASTVRASDRGLSFYVRRRGRRVVAESYAVEDLYDAPGGFGRCF